MFKITAVATTPSRDTVEWETPWFVDICPKFTDEEFAAIAAKLPKYVNVRNNRWCRIYLAENGANRGRNENGIKRLKKLVEVVGADKFELQSQNSTNTYKSLEEFLKAL